MAPDFECQVCGGPFDAPQSALDKCPGGSPKYRREHSPKKSQAQPKGGGQGSARRNSGRGGASRGRVENLTLEQVLQTYTEGPRLSIRSIIDSKDLVLYSVEAANRGARASRP